MQDPSMVLLALIATALKEFGKTIREAQKCWKKTLRLLAIIAGTVAVVAIALWFTLPLFAQF